MKSALVIGNGEMSVRLTESFTDRFDLTVALDGAFNELPSDVEVDYVCGDLDSLTLPTVTEVPQNRKFRPHGKVEVVELPSQDANDLEKTLLWLQEKKGIDRLVIINIWGGRIDQTLASLSILIRYHKELEIVLYSEGTSIRVLSAAQRAEIPTQAGDGISVCAVSEVSRVSLTGVQWRLNSEELLPGSRGVSNKAIGDSVSLEVESGTVIVTHRISDDEFAFRTL